MTKSRDLIRAAAAGNLHNVKELLREGVDVNGVNHIGQSALMSSETMEVAKYLVDHGADIRQKDDDGWTALMWSINKNNVELTKFLISLGVDVNARDNMGWSALLVAADEGNISLMEILIDQGVDVNETNDNGWTALMLQAGRGSVASVKRLLEFGADLTLTNNDRKTASDVAKDAGHHEVVLLLERFVDCKSLESEINNANNSADGLLAF